MSASYLARLLAALDLLPAGVTVDVSLSLPFNQTRPMQLIVKSVGRKTMFFTINSSGYRARHMRRPEPLPDDPAVLAHALITLPRLAAQRPRGSKRPTRR